MNSIRKSGITGRIAATSLAAVFILSALGGCSARNAPDYYQLSYVIQPSTCSKPFPGAVRIWPISASAPYDNEKMVVVSPSHNVRFSSDHKWVGPPANMLTDALVKDMSSSDVFENAVPVGSPIFAAYEMSGHVHRFALEENGSPPHAVLDLEITVWQEKPVRTILLKKSFHYKSDPLSQFNPSAYAEAMSRIVSQFSVDLRNELCAVKQGNSRQDGD